MYNNIPPLPNNHEIVTQGIIDENTLVLLDNEWVKPLAWIGRRYINEDYFCCFTYCRKIDPEKELRIQQIKQRSNRSSFEKLLEDLD